MDVMTNIILVYVGISFLIAYFWGRKLQMGFWWALFFMFGFLPGWFVMMNDDLEVTAQAPKKSSWKVFFGLILMILSVYLLYVFFKDSGGQAFNEYLSLTLACLWLSGLGYYFIRRGCSVVFNHNPQTKPKYAQQQGTKSDTKPEYKSMLQSESKSSPKPEPKSVPLQRTRYDSKPEPKLSDIITVEYKPNIEENLGSYPVLRIPKKGCVVRMK